MVLVYFQFFYAGRPGRGEKLFRAACCSHNYNWSGGLTFILTTNFGVSEFTYTLGSSFGVCLFEATRFSQSTTSAMGGRLKGFWLTHMQAISSTLSISSSKPFPCSRGSKISSCLPSFLICCTHATNSLDTFGLNISIGLLPVSSSSMTTPKLYTSPLKVAIHD